MDQLLIIFLSLLLGYSFKRLPLCTLVINRLLMGAIIFLLLLMGFNFGVHAEQLFAKLWSVAQTVSFYVTALFFANLLIVGGYFFIFEKREPAQTIATSWYQQVKYWLVGLQYLLMVAAGMLLGAILQISIHHITLVIDVALSLMLFLIGHQLRLQEMTLRQILLNRQGILISSLVLLSSAVVAVIGGYLLSVPFGTSLMLVSGFGWYTLSGILTQQLVSEYYGSIAFFIDFLREIIALVVIPILGRINHATAIAYAGAPAMDTCLPILSLNLGMRTVPVAVTAGTLLTILSPILIPLFAKLSV